MPKLLITAGVLVNFGDDRGGQHVDAAEIADVPKESAAQLVALNRALYVEKKDDPSKGGVNTASPEELKAAEGMRKQRAAAAKIAGASPDQAQ